MLYSIISLLIFLAVSIPILIQDIKTYTLNPLYIYLGTIILTVQAFLYQRNSLIEFFISGIIELLIFLFVWLITHRKMGIGDIKYSFLCGLVCGNIFNVVLSTLIASLAGIVFFICLGVWKKMGNEKRIPFTPFMFLGTAVISILSLLIE